MSIFVCLHTYAILCDSFLDLETHDGEGDKGKRLDMGTSSALVPRQAGTEVSGDGLMCITARRGLSKYDSFQSTITISCKFINYSAADLF